MKDKPAYKSKTVWGAALISVSGILAVVGQYLGGGIDMAAMLNQLAPPIGAFLAIFGFRDAVGKKK